MVLGLRLGLGFGFGLGLRFGFGLGFGVEGWVWLRACCGLHRSFWFVCAICLGPSSSLLLLLPINEHTERWGKGGWHGEVR